MADKNNLDYYNSVVQVVKKNRLYKKNNNIDYSKRLIKNERKYKRFQRSQKRLSLRERSYDRFHSSTYAFDFVTGNFRSFFIVFLLFIGFYMVAMTDNIENINPFESGISILQEVSDMGHDAKLNMQNFVKSLSVWGNDLSWNDLNNNGDIWNGSGEVLKDTFNGGVLTRLLKSIGYSFVAIFNFLKFIFRLIVLIFRVLGGIF